MSHPKSPAINGRSMYMSTAPLQSDSRVPVSNPPGELMPFSQNDHSETQGCCDRGDETYDTPLHICHVASALKGGSEVMVSQLVAAQILAGHTVSIVYSPLRDRLEEFRHLFPEGISFIPWNVGREINARADYRAFRDICDILIELRPAIVHLHNSKAGALGRIACKRGNIPCVYTPHGLPFLRKDISWWKRWLHFSLEWLLSLSGGRLVALSQSEADAIRWMPCSKSLIGNGIDVEVIRAFAAEEPVGLSSGRFRIVLSGRIETPKDPHTVSRIASRCPDNWEWVWIGDGTLKHILDDSGRFTVTGWVSRERALGLVQSADVFLQASLWEGMSFALLEAMALERACVVSNAVGNRDLVTDGATGLVCDEVEGYVTVLKRLAADREECVRLGAAARQSVADQYGLEAINSRWANLYADMLRVGLSRRLPGLCGRNSDSPVERA